MNSREKCLRILDRQNTGSPGYWVGHPNEKTIPLLAEAWGIEPTREAIQTYLDDDLRWVPADAAYHHPEGRPAFDPTYGIERHSQATEGCLAEAETLADVEAYPWPDPAYCDFIEIYAQLDKYPNKICFTGMWSPFFHIVADMFGMQNYFIKMYECPDVVEAVTERVVDFYVAANERFFSGLGERADVMFFGNDFGTQLDLFISPEQFRQFVLPSFKRLIAVGKKYGKKIALHSCGSIYRIIPDLIDAGVDILHPLQAAAAGMSAESLRQFKNDIAFLGGIDAQTFMVNATPDEIRWEVERVWNVLGPNIILSPSHEEVLPNVPAANIKAISDTVHSLR